MDSRMKFASFSARVCIFTLSMSSTSMNVGMEVFIF